MGKPYHLFKYKTTGMDTFTVIGHRGACHYYPENTLASIEGALGMGAEMVEIDAQLSKDGVPVVFHDEDLGRCTDGRGPVASHTLQELKKLDAGSWFDKKFRNERIPTLEEVLAFCRDRIALNIEIKTEAVTEEISGGIEEKCIALVEKYGMKSHVVFSSFDQRVFHHLVQLETGIARAVLWNRRQYDKKAPSMIVEELHADAFNCSKDEISPQWMMDLERSNIPVNIYTVNDEGGMGKLINMGASGIFTNRPDVLLRAVRETSAQVKK